MPGSDVTGTDMAQLPVAHAQHILPDMATSGHVTDVTSGHVTSGHVTSGHVTSGCSPLLPFKYCACPAFSRVFFLVVEPDVTKGHLTPFGVPFECTQPEVVQHL
jgi:hypothetical protein